ncbi:MAG TPA: precorrin-6A reductase [Bacillota bacterium]|nr:precorrin-6A reductase [Bacillota bacterium]
MILVLSGTREGREISWLLAEKGYRVSSARMTEHATRLIIESPDSQLLAEHHLSVGLENILSTYQLKLVIDAAHPSPSGISAQIKEYCNHRGLSYLRFAREEVVLPESSLLHPVYSLQEAAEKAAALGNTIFLTTGSHKLAEFLQHPDIQGKRVVVRVLPDHRVLEGVQALGIPSRDIVAMQGPFSREMNRITFKMYNAAVIVTRDSGNAGGTDSKIAAALSQNLPVVIIRNSRSRDEQAVQTYDGVLEKVRQLI